MLRAVQREAGRVWKEPKKLQELEGGCWHTRVADRAKGTSGGGAERYLNRGNVKQRTVEAATTSPWQVTFD